MPPRRLTAKTGQKHEMEAFAEKYDTFALLYGDPVETIFAIMDKNINGPFPDDEIALRAAEMLMSYRYPRVKASEGTPNKAPMVNFTVTMGPPKTAEVTVNSPPQLRPPLTIVTEPK